MSTDETCNNSLYLVDGSSLAFRSFFALIGRRDLRSSQGMPTGAIYGFFQAIFDLVEKRQPHCLAVCFDMAEPTFRHDEFKEYKAHRDEMPDDLARQWPLIKDGVAALGIPVYELAGYEADDIIGTVAKAAEKRGMDVVVLTGDQDIFQLLDDQRIQVLMPSKEGLVFYQRQEVFNKLGVWPEQIIDYKGLCGDSSDNIPGVKGIGPKTAVQLLSQFQNIEGIYENLDKLSSVSQKTKLQEGHESAIQSKRLATICLDTPIQFDFEHCRLTLPPTDPLIGFLRNLEMNSLLRRLPKVLKCFNEGVEPAIDPELLEPVGKPKSARPPMKKQEVLVEAYSGGTGLGGGVAVVEQRKLDLSISVRTQVTIKQTDSAQTEIVRRQDQLDAVAKALSEHQLVSMEVLTDAGANCDARVVGIALALSTGTSLTADKRPQVDLENPTFKTYYIPLRHEGQSEQLDVDVVYRLLKPHFQRADLGKMAYNAKPKINALALDNIELGPIVFDPMLASFIVGADDNHKLSEIAVRHLGRSVANESDIQGSGKKQLSWDKLPVESAAQFAVDTACTTLELCAAFLRVLDHDQQELLWDMDLPLSSVLARMEQNGVKLDVPYFEAFGVELSSELARLEKEIYELAGHGFNINSPLQLQKILFEELKLPTKTKTKSGYSTDAAVLESLADKHPIVSKILEYRHVSKLSSTYVESLPRQISPRDGRLHGEFNMTVASTGRLSSTNPNLQNIPIRTELGFRIREGFIASSPEHVLISADYSQIELRVLAHMSGDERLLEAFKNDEDIHSRTASDVFETPLDKVTSDLRRIGKTLNFALIYQQGAQATAQQLGVSTKQASEFIEKYFHTYPKVRQFMNSIIEEARQRSYVETLWGRRRYFRHLFDANGGLRSADERAACNAPLQGSAADLVKRAMNRLDEQLRQNELKAKLILQVHDELVLDVPVAELESTKQIVVKAMTDEPLNVPLKVDLGVGKNWKATK